MPSYPKSTYVYKTHNLLPNFEGSAFELTRVGYEFWGLLSERKHEPSTSVLELSSSTRTTPGASVLYAHSRRILALWRTTFVLFRAARRRRIPVTCCQHVHGVGYM